MRLGLIIAAVAACAVLSGCAPSFIWVKPGGYTQQDFNQDSYTCEKDERQSGHFDDGLMGAIEMQSFFNKCMVAHGWVQQQQAAQSSPAQKEYVQRVRESSEQLKSVAGECRAKRENGELKNYRESAKCSNAQMTEIFEGDGFPRMDLIEQISKMRLEVARRLDKKQITESQGEKEIGESAQRILTSGIPQ